MSMALSFRKAEILLVMLQKIVLIILVSFAPGFVMAQKPEKQHQQVDTLFTDYDELFNELDFFLDSLMAPRNFTMVNLGVTSGFYNYETSESYTLEPTRKIVYSPSIAYFSKSGLGISSSASIINDKQQLNPYQYSLTGSFDYAKNRKFITGVSITRFFTKNDLPFYTSPLQNGAYTYFTYRNFWLKPTVAVSYGWGSRSEYTEREEKITSIRLKPRGYTRVNTQESINDLNMVTSVRHDFYWLNVLASNDYIRITPQITFISGTQKFGINETTNTYATVKGTGINVLYNSKNNYLDDRMVFQPLSLTGIMKAEYSKGKFFIQPQLMFDYYFPGVNDNLSTAFLINAGVIF